MSTTIPAGRVQLSEWRHGSTRRCSDSQPAVEIDHELRGLIDIRASQLNGCAFCLDMHWRDARAAGESEERLYMLDSWRESTLYSEREQARARAVRGDHADHRRACRRTSVWERARAAFDEHELSQLVVAITVINAWNRLNITTRLSPATTSRESSTNALPPRGRSDHDSHNGRTDHHRVRDSCGPTSCGWPTATSGASPRPRTSCRRRGCACEAPIRAEIRNLRAWLTTVVSRLALDALTSARARREQYVGPWLPEPVIDIERPGADPASHVDLDESVSMALLVVLEALSPAERSAFVLHDVFGYSFAEVAQIVGRTPQATRQLATRARHAVEARRPRHPAGADEQREVVSAFHAATEKGDLATLLELLDPAVTFRSDGGGLVNAARKVFTGAERVVRIFTAFAGHFGDQLRMTPILVNGSARPAACRHADRRASSRSLSTRGRITELDLIRNPEKLRTLRGASPGR